MGTLYLVATPIGNMEDITLRGLRVLREVRLIAAEDTRHTRKLLTHFDIHTDLISYHEHNKAAAGKRLVDRLAEGDIALVSDAGTPLLSDPGYELVQDALAAGYTVCAVPGASAPLTALAASGLPTDSFTFLGYVPRKAGERERLFSRTAQSPQTLIFFEVPHRLRESLSAMAAVYGDRRVAVCRELTKKFEEIRRGTLAEMLEYFTENEPRGEFTIVAEGAVFERWSEQQLRAALVDYMDEGVSRREASRELAKISGWPRNHIYELSLEE